MPSTMSDTDNILQGGEQGEDKNASILVLGVSFLVVEIQRCVLTPASPEQDQVVTSIPSGPIWSQSVACHCLSRQLEQTFHIYFLLLGPLVALEFHKRRFFVLGFKSVSLVQN